MNPIEIEGDVDAIVSPNVLKRSLTFVDSYSIIVGIIIGSGIFSSPGVALSRAGSTGAVLIAWFLSGILVCVTAQCYFELGSLFPTAGGDYDYLMAAYGEATAFSFAWFNFFISKPGSQAIIATIFGRYISSIDMIRNNNYSQTISTEESASTKFFAILLIVILTFLNCSGLKESTYLQKILTGAKIFLVLSIFLISMVYSYNYPTKFYENLSPSISFQDTKVLSFGSAMIACLWSFDGWADMNFMLEELLDTRQLPSIVWASLFTVTFIYILANIAYFSVLSKDEVMNSPAIAVQVGHIIDPSFILPAIFSLGVALSAAGSDNGSIMTGGRAIFAVARDGKLPSFLASVNKAGAPYAALLAQGIWTIVLLILPGSNFSSLLDFFGPCSWFFYALSSSAVIILRRKEPDVLRSFKVFLYPLPPLIVCGIAFIIIISSFHQEPIYTTLAFGFVSLSIPVHYCIKKYNIFMRQWSWHTLSNSEI